jgi:hypothetical protein
MNEKEIEEQLGDFVLDRDGTDPIIELLHNEIRPVEEELVDSIYRWMHAEPGRPEAWTHGHAQGIARALSTLKSTPFVEEWERGLDGYQKRATSAILDEIRSKNRFADCTNMIELVLRTVGAASTAWVGGVGRREFDTIAALHIADDCIDRMIELRWGTKEDKKDVPYGFYPRSQPNAADQ